MDIRYVRNGRLDGADIDMTERKKDTKMVYWYEMMCFLENRTGPVLFSKFGGS